MTRRTREPLIILSKLEDSVAPVLYGDNVRVRQILGNLTSNAIKFTYKGSVTITVTQPTKGQIMFAVKDTGLGISETDQRKLFGKYEQLATFRPSTAGTTGLGLCISKSLVKRMGGKMGVDSKPKQGSTFWFTLPVIDPPVKAKRRSVVGRNDSPRGDGGLPSLELPREITSGPPHVEIHREPPPKPEDLVLTSDDLRVLVAEDNPVLQMTLKAMLMRLGITPVVVGNGADVVKECGGDPFDLLILDIQVSGTERDRKERGLRAIRRVRFFSAVLASKTPSNETLSHSRVQSTVDNLNNSWHVARMSRTRPVDPCKNLKPFSKTLALPASDAQDATLQDDRAPAEDWLRAIDNRLPESREGTVKGWREPETKRILETLP